MANDKGRFVAGVVTEGLGDVRVETLSDGSVLVKVPGGPEFTVDSMLMLANLAGTLANHILRPESNPPR